jgi:tRNA pseudouridine38-40 synthase
VRVCAKVAYDGTGFAGFQKQANVRTVQGELESALEKVCERKVAVVGAGRTDAGVHASGQVIAFDVEWVHSLEQLTRALNVNLAEDVAVRELRECDAQFHPRYSAISRTYEYNVIVSEVRDPLRQRFTWHLEHLPDVGMMNEAAGCLIGSHDFAAFGSAPSGRDDETTVRDVKRAGWIIAKDMDSHALMFTIEANAFLYRMVRRTVMALVRVGCEQLSLDGFRDMLISKDAQRLKGLAPACGLCLVDVKY